MNIVVLLSGGSGTRMQAALPKQHIKINNQQIIEYTLTAFSACEQIDAILVVSNPQYIDHVLDLKSKFSKLSWVIGGGESRIQSVEKGVAFLEKICTPSDKIIISDAVRPCISLGEIERILNRLEDYPAVTTGVEIYETILKAEDHIISDIIPRDGIVRQTSPEGYVFSTLIDLYINEDKKVISQYKNIGIDQLFSRGTQVGLVESNPLNFKITTQDDIYLFENVLKHGFQAIINRRVYSPTKPC